MLVSGSDKRFISCVSVLGRNGRERDRYVYEDGRKMLRTVFGRVHVMMVGNLQVSGHCD